MGSGRALVLGVDSRDPVLSWIGAMGLALVCGTALVIDLESPSDGGDRSLLALLSDGPRLDEISPARTGVAVMRAGDVEAADLEVALETLGRSWPALVLRTDGVRWDGATVPYRALYPGVLGQSSPIPAVWQPVDIVTQAPGPGPILPHIRPSAVRLLLHLKRPMARKWVRSWRRVWEMPWA